MTNFPAKKIGIFGHVGTQNLGDEIIIASVIQNIRNRYPDAEIRAFTFNPEDTRARHGVPAYPIRRTNGSSARSASAPGTAAAQGAYTTKAPSQGSLKTALQKIPFLFGALKALQGFASSVCAGFAEIAFLGQSYKNLRGTDLLIIAGSGQLTDHSGGAWAYPYTFFKWTLIARLLGTKIAFVSIGTSWIDSRLSKFFLKSALSRADYRSCRDESSANEVAKLGIAGETPVVPDLAYSLRLPVNDSLASAAGARKTVGINPIPFFHETMWHKANKRIYEQYVETQAAFGAWLIARGYDVRYFPTQLRADPPAISAILDALRRQHPEISGNLVVDPPLRTGDDLIAAMRRVDIIVAARFHGVLVSHLLQKPVLAVSYHQKTSDLQARMVQQGCTLDIDDCNLEGLQKCFIFLESHFDSIPHDFEQRVPPCRSALAQQYDRVLALLDRPHPERAQVQELSTRSH